MGNKNSEQKQQQQQEQQQPQLQQQQQQQYQQNNFPINLSQSNTIQKQFFQKPQVEEIKEKFDDDELIDVTIRKTENKDKVNLLHYLKSYLGNYQCLRMHQIISQRNAQLNSILPVMVSLKTNSIQEENKENAFKPGIDIICVIDKSGSMSGAKLELVKNTLKYIIDILCENDRFCLISFESSAERLCPLLKVNQENKIKFEKIFSNIQATGGTTINSGMTLALQTLKDRKVVNHVSSIFLLSDGQDANAELAVSAQIQYANIQDIFTIHTFGFGTDHDGKLMKSLSALKDGNFYYIETLDIVNECFVDALGGLISVIAQNVKLTCKLVKQPFFSDMRIIKTYGNNWKYNEETQEYTLIINQLMGGVSKDNILEINIPPIKKQLLDTEKNLDILSFALEFNEINSEKEIQKMEALLNIQFFNEGEQFKQGTVDKDVSINYLRVKAAQSIEEARNQASQRKYKEAQQILEDAMKLISSSEYHEEPCLLVLLNDLKNSKNACDSSVYETIGNNLMVQKATIHMNQQSAPMQSNEYQFCAAQQELYSNNIQTTMRFNARSKKP